MTNPLASELLDISKGTNIYINHLRSPLDEEERARIEVEDNYTVILVDIPTLEKAHEKERYITIPLGIIVSKDYLITVCLEDTPILKYFKDGRVRDFYTFKRTRFILGRYYTETQTTFFKTFVRLTVKVTRLKESFIYPHRTAN